MLINDVELPIAWDRGLALVERNKQCLSLVNVKRNGSKVTKAGACIEKRLELFRIALEREIVILIDKISRNSRVQIEQFDRDPAIAARLRGVLIVHWGFIVSRITSFLQIVLRLWYRRHLINEKVAVEEHWRCAPLLLFTLWPFGDVGDEEYDAPPMIPL